MIHRPSRDGGWRVLSIRLQQLNGHLVTSKPKYVWVWGDVGSQYQQFPRPLSCERAFSLYFWIRDSLEYGEFMAIRLVAPNGVVVAEQYYDNHRGCQIVWPATWRVVGKVRFGKGGIG
jgi:hypothetical protein